MHTCIHTDSHLSRGCSRGQAVAGLYFASARWAGRQKWTRKGKLQSSRAKVAAIVLTSVKEELVSMVVVIPVWEKSWEKGRGVSVAGREGLSFASPLSYLILFSGLPSREFGKACSVLSCVSNLIPETLIVTLSQREWSWSSGSNLVHTSWGNIHPLESLWSTGSPLPVLFRPSSPFVLQMYVYTCVCECVSVRICVWVKGCKECIRLIVPSLVKSSTRAFSMWIVINSLFRW